MGRQRRLNLPNLVQKAKKKHAAMAWVMSLAPTDRSKLSGERRSDLTVASGGSDHSDSSKRSGSQIARDSALTALRRSPTKRVPTKKRGGSS